MRSYYRNFPHIYLFQHVILQPLPKLPSPNFWSATSLWTAIVALRHVYFWAVQFTCSMPLISDGMLYLTKNLYYVLSCIIALSSNITSWHLLALMAGYMQRQCNLDVVSILEPPPACLHQYHGLFTLLITSSSFCSIISFSPTATFLFSSAATNSTSRRRILSS